MGNDKKTQYALPEDLQKMLQEIQAHITQLEREKTLLLTGWMSANPELDKSKPYVFAPDFSTIKEQGNE